MATRLGLIGVLVVGVSATAFAADIPLLQLTCGHDDGLIIDWNPVGTQIDDNVFSFVGSKVDPDEHWELSWTITVDTDPYVDALFALKNATGIDQTYTLEVELPVSPAIAAPSLMGGSVAATLTDADFSGAATLSSDETFYAGKIDGASVLPMDPVPFPLVVSGGGSAAGANNLGLPGPTLTGPAVAEDIGIRHRFTLTPGDSMSTTSFFVVIPEPASLALLGIGAAAILWRRR